MNPCDKIITEKELRNLREYFNTQQQLSLHNILLDTNAKDKDIIQSIDNGEYNITECIISETPLSIAIKTKRISVICELIKKLVKDGLQDNFNIRDKCGRTALISVLYLIRYDGLSSLLLSSYLMIHTGALVYVEDIEDVVRHPL